MADIGETIKNFLVKAGVLKETGPPKVKPAVAKPGARPPAKPGVLAKPEVKFEPELAKKALTNFYSDFFQKKVPVFFRDPSSHLKKTPDWFKALPNDEKGSYGAVVVGFLLLIIGIILAIIA